MTKTEVDAELQIALAEVGEIKPWFDKEVNAFIFEHPLYPVQSGGYTPEEAIADYKDYLKEFIKQRLADNLAPNIEARTSGRGGYRPGSGRHKGSTKDPTKMVRLPVDIADWIKADPVHIENVRKMMTG